MLVNTGLLDWTSATYWGSTVLSHPRALLGMMEWWWGGGLSYQVKDEVWPRELIVMTPGPFCLLSALWGYLG